MPDENTRYESQPRNVTSAVWNLVASKAGYLDAEPLWTYESIRARKAAADFSSAWRTKALLKTFRRCGSAVVTALTGGHG